ncbi:Hint domain-containing protein [Yoonia sp. SS1-5]|uniref:Hint domain-containing protein n=1 Tax=Yoonia rhodophyticola TaxID=3137370 RepID=A0AAN0NHC2_9RHOB
MQSSARQHPVNPASLVRTDLGLCAGTCLMTTDGEIPVEHLTTGDRIIVRDGGIAILREVKSRQARISPIVIKAGSLGHTKPGVDMTVTPATRIHVRDWRASVLFGQPSADIEARRLADGEFVARRPSRLMQLFDLHFDTDQIVYADGVEIMIPAAA